MKCPHCGNEVKTTDVICPLCGSAIHPEKKEESKGSSSSKAGNSGKGKGPLIAAIIVAVAIVAVIAGVSYYRTNFIAKEIHLGETSIVLITGESEQLNYEILPTTTKNKTVTWSVDDASVATVDENGNVLALASGTCVITVSTANGKIDNCDVLVKDFVDIQKEAADSVRGYVDANGVDNEESGKDLQVKLNTDGSTFTVTTEGEDLILSTAAAKSIDDMDIQAEYTTDVRLSYGNIETAEASQENVVTICGVPVVVTAQGTLLLADYKKGQEVAFDSIEATIEELKDSSSLHKIVNTGVKTCYEEFASFLEQHAEFGYTISDFGFVAVQDAEPEYVEEDVEVLSVAEEAESLAENVESYAEEVYATVVESVVEPSTESVYEEVTESVPATIVEEIPAVESAVEAVEVESVVEELPAAVESVVEEVPAVVESVVEAVEVEAVMSAVESVVAAVVVEECADVESDVCSTVESMVEDVVESGAEAPQKAFNGKTNSTPLDKLIATGILFISSAPLF